MFRTLMLSLIVSFTFSTLAEAPASQAKTVPSSQPAYQPGLVQEVYTLPRRPKRVREVLPGLPPKVVRVAPSPVIRESQDLAELTGNVQAEFHGEIFAPEAGEYFFSAESDDGMELDIDDKLVVKDAWINGRRSPSRGSISLTAGWHPIRVRFYQGDGGFGLGLRWRTPEGGEFKPIPDEQYRVPADVLAAAHAKLTPSENPDPSTAHRAVFRSRGFFELPEDEGDLLVELLEGPTNYSAAARKDLSDTLNATNYEKLPYWHQLKVLAGFLRGWYGGQTQRGTVSAAAEYTLSEPQAVEYGGWRGAKRNGFKHLVTIGKKTYTIFTPAADSPERENAAKGIASLPEALRVLLNTVIVEPYGTANEFNGGGDTIWVRRGGPTSAEMIENTFSHEIGHLLMNKTDNYRPWETAIAKDILSLSHYGRSNPTEDFAEFTRLYLSTEGNEKQLESLRKLFPARFAVMESSLKEVGFEWIDSSNEKSGQK